MRQTKRKIVALSTAFVMAFALVAAMLPTVSQAKTNWIKSATVTIAQPEVNTTIKFDGTSKPSVTVPDASPYTLGDHGYMSKEWADFEIEGDWTKPEPALPDPVTVTEGETYYAQIVLYPTEGNKFEVNMDTGKPMFTPTINGGELYDCANCSEDQLNLYVKIKVGGGSTDSVPVKAGDNQTVTPGSPVVISFDKEFSKFENGGAVFLDDSTEPLSTDCYTATSGSTVITLLDSFTKTLKEGAHTLKVKFNDDSVGTATFTVSASANSDGSASDTSGTATSGTSSSAATTTKVAAPKTADVLPFAAIAVVFVGATAIGVIAIRRKNS